MMTDDDDRPPAPSGPLDNLLQAYGDLLERAQRAEARLEAIRVIVGGDPDEDIIDAVQTVVRELAHWEREIPSTMDQLTRGAFDLAKMRGERDEARTTLAICRSNLAAALERAGEQDAASPQQRDADDGQGEQRQEPQQHP